MNAIWLALIPALGGIIGAVGTIMIARWQQKGQSQVFLTQKVDEIIDERVSEMKADRDNFKTQLEQAWQERNQLSVEQMKMRETVASLKTKIQDIELHRAQALTRMRHEVNAIGRKNTVLLAKNAELETQLNLLQQENQQLRQQINELQQRPD